MPDGLAKNGALPGSMAQIQALAEAEGQSVENMLEQAISLYASLPQPARRSLRGIDVLGGPQDRAAAGIAAGRAILHLAFDVARREIAEAGAKYAAEHGITDEAAAITEAVRITKEAERAER